MKTLITFAKRNVYKIVPRLFWLFLVENRSIFTDLTEGEILFFNLINNCCRTIVDIGARTDVFYSFNPPPINRL